jgi:hypothetical protein
MILSRLSHTTFSDFEYHSFHEFVESTKDATTHSFQICAIFQKSASTQSDGVKSNLKSQV